MQIREIVISTDHDYIFSSSYFLAAALICSL